MKKFEITYKTLLALICIFLIIPASAPCSEKKSPVYLSLDKTMHIALNNNIEVQIAKLDAYINKNNLGEAVSVFDTYLKAGAGYDSSRLDVSSQIFGTKNSMNNYSLSLTKKLPSGTTLEMDLYNKRSWTNSAFESVNPNTDANVKMSLVQPLLKDFFGIAERNNVKITRMAIKNSDWASLNDIELSLFKTEEAYWQLVLEYEKLHIKKDMMLKAKELYDIYKRKFRIGLVEDPDLISAESNVLLRKNDVLISEMLVKKAQNNLDYLLGISVKNVVIIPSDNLSAKLQNFGLYNELSRAIRTRRDYKIAKNTVGLKALDLAVKKNALWPQIDLEASFAKNGIDTSYKDAWTKISKENHNEWYIGMGVSLPLERSREKALRNKANIEKAKALVLLKRAERLIFKDINNNVTELNILRSQVKIKRKIVQFEREKLQAEQKRLRYGRSSSDIIIRYQDDLLSARLSLAESLYAYKVALARLELSENILLKKYWKGTL